VSSCLPLPTPVSSLGEPVAVKRRLVFLRSVAGTHRFCSCLASVGALTFSSVLPDCYFLYSVEASPSKRVCSLESGSIETAVETAGALVALSPCSFLATGTGVLFSLISVCAAASVT
jgi:hypothetical protein